MVGPSLTIVVAGLCLAAGVATVALVKRLARHPRPTLRAKLITLFIGLVGAEGLSVPALLVVVAGEDIIGLGSSGFEHWLVVALYVLLVTSVDRPINVLAGLPGMNLSVTELGKLGVKRISLGSNLFRTAFGAALRGAQEILNDGTFGYAGDAATFKEISALFDD